MIALAEVQAFWDNAKPNRWHEMSTLKPVILDHYQRLYVRATQILGYQPTRIVDYGVGGGAMASKALAHGTTYYGIDISQSTLDAAAAALSAYHGTFVPVLIPIDEPELVDIEPCDLFICLTVYQHLPSKEYANRITRLAYDLLKPGGLALIQVRTGEHKRRMNGPYKRDWIAYCLYDRSEFAHEVTAAGFDIVDIRVSATKGISADYLYCYARKP